MIVCIKATHVGLYLAIFLALHFGSTNSQLLCNGTLRSTTCRSEDLELMLQQNKSEHAVMNSIQSVFPRLGSTMTVTLHDSLAEVAKLLYEVFSSVYQLNATKSGLSKFTEAISEISSGYALACFSPLEVRPAVDDIPKLIKAFAAAYDQENSLEVRHICGQMLCFHDHLSTTEGRGRQRRNTRSKNCSCPPDGIDKSTRTCEFFDCLDEGDKLKPIFLNFNPLRSLAFVIDTTGSMKDEINLATQVVKDFIGSQENNISYLLVPFNDNGSGPGLNESNVKLSERDHIADHLELIQSLENSFQQKSGGDCREYSYEAINWALDQRSVRGGLPFPTHILYAGSQVIVLTDAPPKGNMTRRTSLREMIIRKAEQMQVCIHFFLPRDTFNCLEDYPDGVEEYKNISDATGGTIIDSGFMFSDFASNYHNHPCKHTSTQTRHKRSVTVTKRQRCHEFYVSCLSHHLTLTANVTTRHGRVIVTRPDNATVKPSYNNPRGKNKLALLYEAEPMVGEWRACVEKGTLEILSKTQILMDFTALYFAQSDEQHRYLTPSPPPGCTAVQMAMMSSKNDLIYSVQIQMLGDNGELAAYCELEKCGLSWTGNVTLPSSGTYSYVLAGQDLSSIPFIHETHKTVVYQSGQDYYNLSYTGRENIVVEVGELVELTFQLESKNPYGPTTFNLNAERVAGFTYTVEQSEVTLSPGQVARVKALYLPASSMLEPGSIYTATLTATNGCITLSASKDIAIMEETPPPTVDTNVCGCQNGGTCSVISYGPFQLEVCGCPPGFRGPKCEFAD